MYGWGKNEYGEANPTAKSTVYEPQLIDGLRDIVSIHSQCAAHETIAVDGHGVAYQWGEQNAISVRPSRPSARTCRAGTLWLGREMSGSGRSSPYLVLV